MASPSSLIALRDVRKSFDGGTTHAVGGVTLEVAAGEFVAIIGGSGSGKTTTLKMINRLIEPDSGDVLIDGVSVLALPAHDLRRRIGYVIQGVGLFPHWTIAENIAVTPQLIGRSANEVGARVRDLLDLVELPFDTFGARMPGELSGGQRQRVGLARALAAEPRIVLMDEPFGALDPVTRDALTTAYRNLHEQLGLTTVMITHDVQEALLMADRLVVMHEGRAIADGAPRALSGPDADPHVRALLDMPRRQARRVRARLEDDAAHG